MAEQEPHAQETTPGPEGTVVRLLDRAAPEEYRREWTARIALPVEATIEGTVPVVIFRLGEEWLALPAPVFQEVSEPGVIRTLPHRRNSALLGLVNVRGELLLCAALDAVLGCAEGEATSAEGAARSRRLLVVGRQGTRLAFPVDEVHGVHRYHPRELLEVPTTLDKATSSYAIGILPWRGKTVGCLNEEALFTTLRRSFS